MKSTIGTIFFSFTVVSLVGLNVGGCTKRDELTSSMKGVRYVASEYSDRSVCKLLLPGAFSSDDRFCSNNFGITVNDRFVVSKFFDDFKSCDTYENKMLQLEKMKDICNISLKKGNCKILLPGQYSDDNRGCNNLFAITINDHFLESRNFENCDTYERKIKQFKEMSNFCSN